MAPKPSVFFPRRECQRDSVRATDCARLASEQPDAFKAFILDGPLPPLGRNSVFWNSARYRAAKPSAQCVFSTDFVSGRYDFRHLIRKCQVKATFTIIVALGFIGLAPFSSACTKSLCHYVVSCSCGAAEYEDVACGGYINGNGYFTGYGTCNGNGGDGSC